MAGVLRSDLLAFSVLHIRKHNDSFVPLVGMFKVVLGDFSTLKAGFPFDLCVHTLKLQVPDNLSPNGFSISGFLTEGVTTKILAKSSFLNLMADN